MSITIVHHVRETSQSKRSASTLLLDLAIYANDCCSFAWPADATLRRETNVSHQCVHELKNTLEKAGELAIVERPGTTSLYFVAWQGQPVGGTFPETSRHDPCCPLQHVPAPAASGISEIPDPPGQKGVSGNSDPQVLEIPDPPSEFSEPKTRENERRKRGPGRTRARRRQTRSAQPLLVCRVRLCHLEL